MISQFGAFTSFQVNVNASGQNILGDAANECSISVDPTNGNKMTIAWRQFNDVTSNFRQAGWGYTTDGGTTWTFPGVLENNVFRSDPVTNSNEIGQFFYLSLQSDVNTSFFCDDLWRSINGGQTWLCSRAKEAAAEATSSGLRSIRPTARDMDSNTSQTTALTAAAAAWNSNVPLTVGSHGRHRSLFLTRPCTERSTWTRTAISLSAEKGAPFTAFARAMPRSAARHQLLTEAPPSTGWLHRQRGNQSSRTGWDGIPGGRSFRHRY